MTTNLADQAAAAMAMGSKKLNKRNEKIFKILNLKLFEFSTVLSSFSYQLFQIFVAIFVARSRVAQKEKWNGRIFRKCRRCRPRRYRS